MRLHLLGTPAHSFILVLSLTLSLSLSHLVIRNHSYPIVSNVATVTLYDYSSGTEHQIENGYVILSLPIFSIRATKDWNPSCIYYNDTNNIWDTTGCTLLAQEIDIKQSRPCVICACSHLTEFAVSSISGNSAYGGDDDDDDDGLSAVEIVIIVLSSVSLFLACLIALFAAIVLWNISAIRQSIKKRRRDQQRDIRMAHLREMARISNAGTHESHGDDSPTNNANPPSPSTTADVAAAIAAALPPEDDANGISIEMLAMGDDTLHRSAGGIEAGASASGTSKGAAITESLCESESGAGSSSGSEADPL